MNLNNIELPPFVVEELYQSSLVDDANIPVKKNEPAVIVAAIEQPTAPLETKGQVWKSLGNNLKNILVIVKNDEAVYLTDEELAFLTGVLTACKLTLADVAIVNQINQPEAGYKELTNHFKSKIVFLFDVEPAAFGLPINFPHYQLQAFAGNSFLYSPSLIDLEKNKVEKSKLWVCLKRLFNL